jgi:hypothetical protein
MEKACPTTSHLLCGVLNFLVILLLNPSGWDYLPWDRMIQNLPTLAWIQEVLGRWGFTLRYIIVIDAVPLLTDQKLDVTEHIQFGFFNIMAPLLHSEDVSDHLKHQTRTLFRHAITLRASCYSHKRTRYQLMQFKPGDVYDPQTMRAEDEVGAIVPVPEDGRQRHIKVCVHGIMKAYSVRENAAGLGLGTDTQGRIISGKAAVILE